MSKNKDEQVLVFPEELLYVDDFKPLNGIIIDPLIISKYIKRIFHSDKLSYIDRNAAETDPRFKQLIPYNVIILDDQCLCYQRTKKAGETRLHGNWSVGVGGHINPTDQRKTTKETYNEAWRRELEEEIEPKGIATNKIKALLYDDSNDVGKVHFGIVHFVELFRGTKLKFIDEALDNTEFCYMHDLRTDERNWENWSKLVIQNLF